MATSLINLVNAATKATFISYDISIKLLSRLHGGTPKSPDMIAAWINARVAKGLLGPEEAARIKQEYKDEMDDLQAATDDAAEKSWRGFRRDRDSKGNPIYLEGRQFKAMFKECSQIAGLFKDVRGTRDLWQHGVAVTSCSAEAPNGDTKIFIDGQAEPDGFEESVVHAMTPQGPRSSIKRNDFIEVGAVIHFRLWLIDRGRDKNAITDEYLAKALAVAQQNGLGADRAQGCGRFQVLKFEKR